MQKVNKQWKWAGILLVLATGIIHLIALPHELEEGNVMGALFLLNCLGSMVAAVGIYRQAPVWGWALGFIICAGSLLAYAVSRTVGLPGMEIEEWLQPLGVASLLAEGLFVAVCLARRPEKRQAAQLLS